MKNKRMLAVFTSALMVLSVFGGALYNYHYRSSVPANADEVDAPFTLNGEAADYTFTWAGSSGISFDVEFHGNAHVVLDDSNTEQNQGALGGGVLMRKQGLMI